MNNYKLYIKNSSSVWKLADLGNDVPAMNYQTNNIAELKDRQSDYSQSLKLPPTPNNCAIFGYSNILDVVTDIPYIKLECRLFANESVLAGQGSSISIVKITDSFETQIIAGNADLFQTLQNSKMSDIDLGVYQYGTKTINSNYSDANYCIPNAVFIKGGETILDTSALHAYPFAYLKNAITKIITSHGYTLTTNLTDAQWNSKALNICSLKPTEESFLPFEASATGQLNENEGDWFYMPFSVINSGQNCLVQINNEMIVYTAVFTCKVKFVISISGNSTSEPLNIKILNNFSDHLLDVTFTPTVSNQQYDYEGYFDLVAGDTLIFSAYLATAPGYYDGTVNITEVTGESIPAKGNISISSNIGFDTQLDLFKAFTQLFGLTVHVDNITKTVYAYTMKKMYDNKNAAKDWSKKLHVDKESETTFALSGYAQTNRILFEKYDTIEDIANFIISNQTLEKTKDIFTIKFEAGKNGSKKILKNIHQIAHIPLEEMSNAVSVFKGGKPHIVNISTVAISTGPVTYAKIATHQPLQTFVDTFYSDLTNKMLVEAKVLEREFYLSDQDIEDYKKSIFAPVWVEYYGWYFYVNKIKNYISGKLTKCELIKL